MLCYCACFLHIEIKDADQMRSNCAPDSDFHIRSLFIDSTINLFPKFQASNHLAVLPSLSRIWWKSLKNHFSLHNLYISCLTR